MRASADKKPKHFSKANSRRRAVRSDSIAHLFSPASLRAQCSQSFRMRAAVAYMRQLARTHADTHPGYNYLYLVQAHTHTHACLHTQCHTTRLDAMRYKAGYEFDRFHLQAHEVLAKAGGFRLVARAHARREQDSLTGTWRRMSSNNRWVQPFSRQHTTRHVKAGRFRLVARDFVSLPARGANRNRMSLLQKPLQVLVAASQRPPPRPPQALRRSEELPPSSPLLGHGDHNAPYNIAHGPAISGRTLTNAHAQGLHRASAHAQRSLHAHAACRRRERERERERERAGRVSD
jgi:hypothetical protein